MFLDDDEKDDWAIRFNSYSGLSYTWARGEGDEMKRQLDLLIKQREKKYEVVQLDDDLWEVCEPEDSAMVPDQCGYIRLIHGSRLAKLE